MKKLFYILTLLFTLPLVGLAQNDSIINNDKQPTFKNQIDLDVQILGVEIMYEHKIIKKIYLGVGIGGGLLTSFNNEGIFVEVYKSRIFIYYFYNNNVHFQVGFKYSPAVIKPSTDDDGSISMFEMGVFKKYKKIEFGINLSLGYFKELGSNSYEKTITIPFLIIKIPLGSW